MKRFGWLLFAAVTLAIPITASAAPSNDDFDHAAEIISPLHREAPDFSEATSESGEPTPCRYGGGKTLWYKYTPLAPRSVAIGGQASVTVYTGTSLENLTQVACHRGHPQSFYTLEAQPLTTYYIQVDCCGDFYLALVSRAGCGLGTGVSVCPFAFLKDGGGRAALSVCDYQFYFYCLPIFVTNASADWSAQGSGVSMSTCARYDFYCEPVTSIHLSAGPSGGWVQGCLLDQCFAVGTP